MTGINVLVNGKSVTEPIVNKAREAKDSVKSGITTVKEKVAPVVNAVKEYGLGVVSLKDEVSFCPKCGINVEEFGKINYCPKCGKKL